MLSFNWRLEKYVWYTGFNLTWAIKQKLLLQSKVLVSDSEVWFWYKLEASHSNGLYLSSTTQLLQKNSKQNVIIHKV